MNGFARGIRRLTSDALLFAALLTLLGSSARAQTPEAEIIRIPLPAGRSYPIHTAVPVTRVSVANPAVADVVVIGERDVVVNARASGETDVIMWMGDTRRHYRVVVNPPMDRRQVSLGIVFAEVRKDELLQFGVSALYRDSHARVGTGIFNSDAPINPVNGNVTLPADANFDLFARMSGVLEAGGFMPPSHISEAIAYLASDAAASVTGAALVVDRGTLW